MRGYKAHANRVAWGAAIVLAIAVASYVPGAAEASYVDQVLSDNPVFYYRLSETTGTTITDATTNGYDGTISSIGGGSYDLDVSGLGSPDSAVFFSGTTQTDGAAIAVDVGTGVIGANYSVEFFFEDQENTVLLNGLFTRGGTVFHDYLGLSVSYAPGIGGVDPGEVFLAGSDLTSFDYDPPADTWLHVVLTRSGTSVDLFVNGALQASVTDTVPTFSYLSLDGQFSFGMRHDDNWPVLGRMDDIAVYDYALTPAQVAAHYASTVPGSGTVISIQ